jgi:hypothetical protein
MVCFIQLAPCRHHAGMIHDVDRTFECSVASRLFSEVGVDVEERIDAFKQSRFDFVRRAVNDV